MVDFLKPIREELRKYENSLENDHVEFNKKLNLTRDNLFNYIDQQIDYLNNIKNEFNEEFNYLDEENKKTCEINQKQFNKLCLAINQNDDNPGIIWKFLDEFKQKFPMRPKMLKSIPEYDCRDINIKDFIIKQEINQNGFEENLSEVNHHSSSPSNHSFIPIDNSQPTGSIGSSHHKQFALQNNEDDIQLDSRLASTCSTINGTDNMVDISFKIPYQHDRKIHLISFNESEEYLLIHLIHSHQLECLSLKTRKSFLINLPFTEPIINLGYSINSNLFYLSTRQTNRFVLFKINQQEKQIEIDHEIELIDKNDHFISVHMHEDFILFLYVSSSIVMLGKYDLEKSSFIPAISFENRLYDAQEKSTYKILDFAVNNSFISFLTQLKTKNKFLIIIHDYDTLNKLHSFDLIDASRPLSIISTQKKSKSTTTTTMRNDEIESLLFVNDLTSHLIHCCTHQEYVIPMQVNAFGICPLNDGNVALVASRDIRGLKVQDYLQRNNISFD